MRKFNVSGTVAPSQSNLWGLQFAEDNGYSWAWDKVSARVIYYTGKFPA